MTRTPIRFRSWMGLCLGLPIVLSSASAAAVEAGDRTGSALLERGLLAAPGRCAEPRDAVDARVQDDFDVVGPATALFDPIDVAAGPPALDPVGGDDPRLRPQPPLPRPLARPGACDQPGSGCGAALPSRPVVTVPPVIPGDRPPRGQN